jgi:hypothetical protein
MQKVTAHAAVVAAAALATTTTEALIMFIYLFGAHEPRKIFSGKV